MDQKGKEKITMKIVLNKKMPSASSVLSSSSLFSSSSSSNQKQGYSWCNAIQKNPEKIFRKAMRNSSIPSSFDPTMVHQQEKIQDVDEQKESLALNLREKLTRKQENISVLEQQGSLVIDPNEPLVIDPMQPGKYDPENRSYKPEVTRFDQEKLLSFNIDKLLALDRSQLSAFDPEKILELFSEEEQYLASDSKKSSTKMIPVEVPIIRREPKPQPSTYKRAKPLITDEKFSWKMTKADMDEEYEELLRKNPMLKPPTVVYHPTIEQLEDFEKFLLSITKDYAFEAGCVKVVLPPEWREKYQPKYTEENLRRILSTIPTPAIKQHAQLLDTKATRKASENQQTMGRRKRPKIYKAFFPEGKKAFMGDEYMDLALSNDRLPNNNSGNNGGEEPRQYTVDEICHFHWKYVTQRTPTYANDCKGTLFVKNSFPLNLVHLAQSTLMKAYPTLLDGINTSFIYLAMFGSNFALHSEDLDLFSINYNHYGAPKHWYTIPPAYAWKYEKFVRANYAHFFERCPGFMRHKEVLIDPKTLRKAGIPVSEITQEEGTVVITFPYGIHGGFNMGFNVAEAINFATKDWTTYGMYATLCLCDSKESIIRIQMDIFAKTTMSNEQYRAWRYAHPDDQHISLFNDPKFLLFIRTAEGANKPISYWWRLLAYSHRTQNRGNKEQMVDRYMPDHYKWHEWDHMLEDEEEEWENDGETIEEEQMNHGCGCDDFELSTSEKITATSYVPLVKVPPPLPDKVKAGIEQQIDAYLDEIWCAFDNNDDQTKIGDGGGVAGNGIDVLDDDDQVMMKKIVIGEDVDGNDNDDGAAMKMTELEPTGSSGDGGNVPDDNDDEAKKETESVPTISYPYRFVPGIAAGDRFETCITCKWTEEQWEKLPAKIEGFNHGICAKDEFVRCVKGQKKGSKVNYNKIPRAESILGKFEQLESHYLGEDLFQALSVVRKYFKDWRDGLYDDEEDDDDEEEEEKDAKKKKNKKKVVDEIPKKKRKIENKFDEPSSSIDNYNDNNNEKKDKNENAEDDEAKQTMKLVLRKMPPKVMKSMEKLYKECAWFKVLRLVEQYKREQKKE